MKNKKNLIISEGDSRSIIIFKDGKNSPKVDVLFRDNMLWLTQKQIGELFGVQKANVSKHFKNIFAEGELDKASTVSILETVQNEGGREVKRETEYYNLDGIISIGYRVNSGRAVIFRNWATKILREFIQKGVVLDDERLKNPEYIYGQDYFDETLGRIRDIRSSERRFYQKITDIYSQCSADYDLNSDITKQFYATVQNKLHWAIHGQTAAEVIMSRVDHKKPNMGLTSWKNAPKGRIRKPDVSIAKNYLSEQELAELNRVVTMYLDYAEDQAKRRQVMYMKDWIQKLNTFLQFNQRDILENPEKISHEIAKAFAENEFDQYRTIEDRSYVSDFDAFLQFEDNTKGDEG